MIAQKRKKNCGDSEWAATVVIVHMGALENDMMKWAETGSGDADRGVTNGCLEAVLGA